MRPWDKHPPWAHWAFYVTWGIAGSLGPILLLVGLVSGSVVGLWIGLGLCLLWGGSLAADWLLVRWLQNHVDGWSPWQPPNLRWLST
jgi:uncharacterized membrane protein